MMRLSKEFSAVDIDVKLEDRAAGERSAPLSIQVSGVAARHFPSFVTAAQPITTAKTSKKQIIDCRLT